jgi:hypothetical protein
MQSASVALPPCAGQDGEWLRHPSWEPVFAELPDPSVGRAALERLRAEFPPRWSLAALDHPVRIGVLWNREHPGVPLGDDVLAVGRRRQLEGALERPVWRRGPPFPTAR